MTLLRSRSTLRRLEAWFRNQCDGDWEHGDAVTIESLDNPGWSLKVRLSNTSLANKPFAELKRDYESDTEWLTCFLRDDRFMGACGPGKLEEMLQVFLEWAEAP